jgi:hypothetical protein
VKGWRKKKGESRTGRMEKENKREGTKQIRRETGRER